MGAVAAHHAHPGCAGPDQGRFQGVTQKTVLQVTVRVNQPGHIGILGWICHAHAVILITRVDVNPWRAHELKLKRNLKEDDMESILYLLLLVGIWVILIKVVFPKIGIHG
jgi:hypothetical protein